MGLRDRFYTPKTAQAILSWRILPALVAGVGLGLTSGPIVGVAAGLALYAGLVGAAMPKAPDRPRIDPFTVQEPWRQFVQGAQRAEARLHETIDAAGDGPVKDRMRAIGDKLDQGLDETWRIARRGHEIDQAVHRLDPTSLRSKLDSLHQRAASNPADDVIAAIESVDGQLASVDRLKEQSTRTANTLRLTQTRLDELVARAAEVGIGTADTDVYEHDVEDLVVELEGLRLAVEETRTA